MLTKTKKSIEAAALASALVIALPAVSSAQEVSFAFGADTFSDYVFEGVSQTDGNVALQPSAFALFGSFYAGVWASNVSLGPNEYELDLIFGYYGEFGNGAYYDLSLAAFYYDETGYDSTAATAKLGFSVGEKVSVEGRVDYNLTYEKWTYDVKGTVSATDKLSLDASFGHSETFEHNFWSVGMDYAVNDNVSLNARYHGVADSAFDDVGLVVGVAAKF